jgi:hypothetical protein
MKLNKIFKIFHFNHPVFSDDDLINMDYFSNSDLYITKSKIENAGNGVFTKKNIKKDDVIEICYIIPFDLPNKYQPDPKFHEYFYNHQNEKGEAVKYLQLGHSIIYNSGEKLKDLNVKYLYSIEKRKIVWIADKDINENEELLIFYQVKKSQKSDSNR